MIEIFCVKHSEELADFIPAEALTGFLHTHLDRFRDDLFSIDKALEYVLDPMPGKGGFILLAMENRSLTGALVMLKTGMSDFVPQNLLVYIAVDSARRGEGIGKRLIERAKELCEGDIALHVEPDNPARHLYERQGFGTKYVEMRWKRD